MAVTPFITDAEATQKIQQSYNQLETQLDAAIFESVKTYDALADAQAVDPKPADGTAFLVSKVTDPDNAGYYTFQSSEPGGTRFEREYLDIQELNDAITTLEYEKMPLDIIDGWRYEFNGTSSAMVVDDITISEIGDFIEFDLVCLSTTFNIGGFSFSGMAVNATNTSIGISHQGVIIRDQNSNWIIGNAASIPIPAERVIIKIERNSEGISLYYDGVLQKTSPFTAPILIQRFGDSYSNTYGYWEGNIYSVTIGTLTGSTEYKLNSLPGAVLTDIKIGREGGLLSTEQENKLQSAYDYGVINKESLSDIYDPYLFLETTPTQISNATLEETYIDEIGDYFEVRCSNPQDGRTPENNSPSSANMYMIGGHRANGGFFNSDNFYFRSNSETGADYRIWSSPVGFDKSKVHTYRLEIVSDGSGGKLWEFFVDGFSWGTKPYSLLANINRIGPTNIGSLQGTIEYMYSFVAVKKSGNTTTYTAEDLFQNAVNAKLLPIETIDGLYETINKNIDDIQNLKGSSGNPECFVSYEKEANKFVVYTKDKTRGNIYYGFDLELQSSIGTDAHEIVYAHLWRVQNGYLYSYSNEQMVRGNQILLGIENEFTYQVSGKADHTGGVHGDERIDIDPTSGVIFYISGVPLTAGDLAESFDLVPCNSFHYLQKATLHETAPTALANTDTGIEASGSGVVTIDSNQNIVIDGVNTGLGAYNQSAVYTPEQITLTTSAENTWVVEPRLYFPVEGHPVVAKHIKKTTFENQGYRTWNRTTFTETQNITQLFVGILCVHKNTAKYVNNEDYVSVEMTGSEGSFLASYGNRLYEGYNDTTKLSSKVESWLLKATNGYVDEDCRMHVWDRATDSKYYRKVMNTNVNPDDIIEGELVVSWNSK